MLTQQRQCCRLSAGAKLLSDREAVDRDYRADKNVGLWLFKNKFYIYIYSYIHIYVLFIYIYIYIPVHIYCPVNCI